jgi:O-antigen ligase
VVPGTPGKRIVESVKPQDARSIAWVVGVVLLSAAAVDYPFLAAVGPAVVLGALVYRWPERTLAAGAFAVLAIRPSLDIFSERRASIGPLTWEPAAAFGAAVLVAGAVLAMRRIRDGRRLWPDSAILVAHWWLAAAMAILFFSGARLFGAIGLAEGVREIARVASIVLGFLIVWWWLEGRPDRARSGWLFLLLGLIPPVATAGWQLATGRGFLEPGSGLRIQGTFSHPNSFAQYLVPFVLLAVSGIPGDRLKGQVWRVVAALGLSLLIVLSYSRTAILVLGTGLAVLPLVQRMSAKRLAGTALAVLLVVGLGWLLVGPSILARFADVSFRASAIQAAMAGHSENSFQWRLINWHGLVLLGLHHPYLGHGAGMTTHLNPLINVDNGVRFNAHNDFVRFFFEGGVLGLACYLIYGVLLCRWAVRQARSLPAAVTPAAAAVAATLLAMLFLTAGITEFSLHTANQYAVYAMLALVAAPWSGDLSRQQQLPHGEAQPDQQPGY